MLMRRFGILILALILSACNQPVADIPTVSILNAAATQTPVPFPTATSFDSTATSAPTLTSLPTLTPTPTPQNTVTSKPQTSRVIFVRETLPDGSHLQPGQSFTKTWTIQNGGSTPWVKGYSLARVSSNPASENLGSPAQIPLTSEVQPGEKIEISVDLTAPRQDGSYTVTYQLQSDSGQWVVGSELWVTIVVGDAAAAGGGNTVNGITVTLTNFKTDEQSTTVDFCMTMPNRYYSLDSPAPSLVIDEKTAPFLEGHSIDPWGCWDMRYQIGAAAIEQAQHIVLRIDASIRTAPPHGDPDVACQSARKNLINQHPGLDFECHFSMAGYYTNLSLPAGLTREQADQLIRDTIEGAIYGPWVITIR